MQNELYNLSPYTYVRNNPLNRFDPDGYVDWPTGKSVVNELKRQFSSSFEMNVVEPIEAANEVAGEDYNYNYC